MDGDYRLSFEEYEVINSNGNPFGFRVTCVVQFFPQGEIDSVAEWKQPFFFRMLDSDDFIDTKIRAFHQAIAEKHSGIIAREDLTRRVQAHQATLEGALIHIEDGQIV